MKPLKRTIYLDHAAATPLHPLAKKTMEPFLTMAYGNPSSIHQKGIEAKEGVELARHTIARIIGAGPGEVVFTSGGTESCNLAILGQTRNHAEERNAGIRGGRSGRGHIITTSIEHHAVLEPVKALQKQGWKAVFLPVDREGFVNIDNLKNAIRKETKLVSIMYANNEVGSIQPILEIGKLLSWVNAQRRKQGLGPILFHTDACQTVGSLDINVNRLQVDLLSASAGKFYGPKGVGFLYVRKGTAMHPILHGGGQERGLRSGTENVAGIVGMAKALEASASERERENQRLAGLRDYLIKRLKQNLPKLILNGPSLAGQQPRKKIKHLISSKTSGRYKMMMSSLMSGLGKRLPNNLNVAIPGVEGEALMLYLDAKGIFVSTGSACATGSTQASHVLRAIGRTQKQAKESIRITLGKQTKKKDLDYFVKTLKQVILLIVDEQ